ncbi:MAG: RecX family transcriptional regulator [Chloroflexota bacterium]|nr:RecX family transcriptional regulator [Chloroflexota bacterium]
MDIITALQADPSDPNKVHLFIDGKHAMSLAIDVAAAERLTVGQQCPPERLERLHAAQELNGVYESAINFLSYRPRSAREVEMRLRKKGHAPEQIATVMERLRDRRYVDDREFARFWVGNRMSFSPRGPRLLRSELRQKGVPQEVVDEVLAEHSEAQEESQQQAEDIAAIWGHTSTEEPAPGTDLATALGLARKRIRSYSTLDPQTARRRLSGFLMRRGYNYDTVDAVMKRVLAFDSEEEASDD